MIKECFSMAWLSNEQLLLQLRLQLDERHLFFHITAFPAANMSSWSSDGKENFIKDELLKCQGYIFSASSIAAYYNTEIYTTTNCDIEVKSLIQQGGRLPITGINISLKCRTKVNAYILQTLGNSIFCRPTVLKQCMSHWNLWVINIYNKVDSRLAHSEGVILTNLPVRAIPDDVCSQTVYSLSSELSQVWNGTVHDSIYWNVMNKRWYYIQAN
jgi:hypothetical protein